MVLVQMLQGAAADGVATARAALQAAKASADENLEAQSLFRLGEALFRSADYNESIVTAQKGADLYQSLNDPSGQGRAYWVMAMAYFQQGQHDETRRTAQTAMTHCQQVGDLYGMGHALNMLTFPETGSNVCMRSTFSSKISTRIPYCSSAGCMSIVSPRTRKVPRAKSISFR